MKKRKEQSSKSQRKKEGRKGRNKRTTRKQQQKNKHSERLQKGANFYARLCSVYKWLLEQEVWIRNRRTHVVNAIISNERNTATGSTVENSA